MDYYSDENVHRNVLGYGEFRYQSKNSVMYNLLLSISVAIEHFHVG